MSTNTVSQSTNNNSKKPKKVIPPLLGAIVGAIVGAVIGISLSRGLGLGERLQQLNVTNTGAKPMRVSIDTARLTGDGEVLIEPGKVGMFIFGEGDVLNIHSGEKDGGAPHVVHMHTTPIKAKANADDPGKITFDYEAKP
jgi:hypothetical protein